MVRKACEPEGRGHDEKNWDARLDFQMCDRSLGYGGNWRPGCTLVYY